MPPVATLRAKRAHDRGRRREARARADESRRFIDIEENTFPRPAARSAHPSPYTPRPSHSTVRTARRVGTAHNQRSGGRALLRGLPSRRISNSVAKRTLSRVFVRASYEPRVCRSSSLSFRRVTFTVLVPTESIACVDRSPSTDVPVGFRLTSTVLGTRRWRRTDLVAVTC